MSIEAGGGPPDAGGPLGSGPPRSRRPGDRIARAVLLQLLAALVLVTVAVVLGVAFSR